jgi:cytochrome c-type biogenesis protein CcmH
MNPRTRVSASRTWLAACLLALASVLMIGAVFAQSSDPTPLVFRDDAEEARFHQLTAELRCVMCQNQSLADSNAQIAHDLRREVLDLMRQGKDNAQIKQFLVERYGEFVLYKPDVAPGTWLLWFGPAALVLIGGVVVVMIVRRRSGREVPPATDDQEW